MPETKQKKNWKVLGRNDWGDIASLSQKAAFRRKFQIVEAFTELIAEKGLHKITHTDIAQKCKITRQLVDHHFPSEKELLLLTYQYVYARFQKTGADAVVAHESPFDQFRAYIASVVKWAFDYKSDACFLAQLVAIASLYPEILAHHERNMSVGSQRICEMLVNLKNEGLFKKIPTTQLSGLASAIQIQIAGFLALVVASQKNNSSSKKMSVDLVRNCCAILGLDIS